MRQLIYIPVIHMSADLGSIAKQVDKRGIAGFGEEFWERHKETISGFWDSIVKYFTDLEVEHFKIYQDGMVTDGEVAQKIVEEGVKSGSKNFEIIENLVKKGAVIVHTEDLALVKKERDRIVRISQAKTITRKLAAYFQYRLTRDWLLRKRDNYVAKRIDETLSHGETGILFMGAYHNIVPKLSKKILITTVKDPDKVGDYQRLLLHCKRNKEEFEELARYLVAPVTD